MTNLDDMQLLSVVDFTESPGKEPVTPVDAFNGRKGYDENFLENWKIELPKLIDSKASDMRELRRGGTGVNLKYQNFSVILSVSKRLPLIAAVNIDGNLSKTKIPRTDIWKFDGRLDKDDQWGDEIYAKNILDRGHMVRREDPVWGTLVEANLANEDTFHFTNSCPQVGSVNQKIWLGLENYILHHARTDKMKVNVFTGPFFSENDIEYRGAKIPLAFWKVVAIITNEGRRSATAYKISQEKELSELEFTFAGYKTFQISVKQVMENTGLDFSELIEYDGYSGYESAKGERLEEPILEFSSIRV